jgi:hypothetical protein
VFGNVIIRTGGLPFRYGPPAGFSELSTENLSAVAIKNPSDHFSAILDTGANILTAAQAKFSNGLWWIKDRANSNQHQWVDSVRGGNLALQMPTPGAETAYVAPSGNSVAWCWNAPDSFTSSAGSISSSGRRNDAAGFSIVSYTGNNTTGATIGHGLSAAPKVMIVKERDGVSRFTMYHGDLGATKYLDFDDDAAAYTSTGSNSTWNSTSPSSTVFTVGANGATNENNMPIIAYCWAEVPGYSSFGTYVGNGNADGPFIYTGFRPAFVLVKRHTTSGGYTVKDSARSPYNPSNIWLTNDSTAAENTGADLTDFLSNGFKIRYSGGQNTSGVGYIYMAFAEHPFGGADVSPSPAR